MTAGIRLTQTEASERFAAAGLELLDGYTNQYAKVRARCTRHGETHLVQPGNVFKGQRLHCCGNAGRSLKHSGKIVRPETKAKLAAICGDRHPGTGKPRSQATRDLVSAGLRKRASSVDYIIHKAATGKTAGEPGYFYVIRCGNGLLKFGSLVRMSLRERVSRLRHYVGEAEPVLVAKVADAGAYEAAMMERHREHWARGEFFHDFLRAAA
ncbi:MAG TPA: hypothetical protein VJP88_00265 [Caulobacteraceae bacterium]|nr:hypothetical protein [Caulobacteraceae bacterium]